MSNKLHVILAKTEHLSSSFKNMLRDFKDFFSTKQGAFKGIKKTYEPKAGTIDEPSMRGNIVVTTTVDEKLQWLVDNSREYIDSLFSVEATNASGTVMTDLIVEGVSWGKVSSLELLRLKSFLEMENFEQMYANIPVRSDAEIWEPTDNVAYANRNIFQKPLQLGVKKSMLKEPYILEDPNLENLKDTSGYKPAMMTRDTPIDLGDYTLQEYSGEYSHLQRAMILKRRSQLLNAVITALKTANEAELIQSKITAEKIFTYLHQGV
jgi:hypothetical protein